MIDTSPAQVSPKLTRAEAVRRNGGRSCGPRTPEGKARSAGNAPKQGLTAQAFVLLPGEDADAYVALLEQLTARFRPRDVLAAHLVQRLASVMWRQQRADRLEAEVLTQLEQRPDSSYLAGYIPYSPHTWDSARFSAVQRQQARLDRALFRLVEELERLAAAAEDRPANDNHEMQNEPDEPRAASVAPPSATPPPGSEPPVRSPSTDVLPLTAKVQDLLDERGADEVAGRLFGEGCRQQVDD